MAALLGVALVGCGVRKIAYEMAPQIILSAMNQALSLNAPQKEMLRPALRALLVWHRHEELPLYVERIDQLRERLRDDLSDDDIRWARGVAEELGGRVFVKVIPLASDLLASLDEEQIGRIEKMARDDGEQLARSKALTPEAWVTKATERATKVLEPWVGSLLPAQKAMIAQSAAQYRVDQLARWQQRNALLFGFAARLRQHPGEAAITLDLQKFFELAGKGADDPVEQARTQRSEHAADELAITLYHSATPEQRRHLDDQLISWRDDFRDLSHSGH